MSNAKLSAQEGSRIDQMQRGEAARLDDRLRGETSKMDYQQRGEEARLDDRLRGETSRMDDRLRGETSRLDDRLRGETSRLDDRLRGEDARIDQLQRQDLTDIDRLQRGESSRLADQEARGDLDIDVMTRGEGSRIDQLQRGEASRLDDQYRGESSRLQTHKLGMDYMIDSQIRGTDMQIQGQEREGQRYVDALEQDRLSTLLSSALGQGQSSQMAANQRSANQNATQNTMASIAAKATKSCLPEGTNIDIEGGKVKVEDIKAGDIVIGYYGTLVKVMQKHEYVEDPTAKRFFEVTFNYEGEKRIVNCCDLHMISNTRAMDIEDNEIVSKRLYSGVETSYDLLTEDIGYRISGIPVNSMIPELKEDTDKAIKRNRKKLKN